MTRGEFREFERRAIAGLAALAGPRPDGPYDEQALPAYTNPNPFMRRVFWRRIRIAAGLIERLPEARLAVDFGSGLGVMIPVLAGHAREVVAVEIEPAKLAAGAKSLGIAPGLFRTVPSLGEAVGPAGPKADLVLALDVLEHVPDLDAAVGAISRVLVPRGRLIVSGPTENAAYRLGRRLAGYSGHYHRRGIRDIERALAREFQIVARKAIYPLLPLFIVLEAVPAPAPPSSLDGGKR
ncbi:MAG TPA: class I SAM-dependent methyltransferase [Acidobacteriota bacterium]|nr:class I SAM-dependent methyltransferase [Acidobacteriota bacterium]